jgi:PPOX class probable F420-dependent enzyme
MSYSELEKEEYISLTTYRKTGLAVSSPVWFALEGDKIYVLSLIHAGKLKRLKNNPNVLITPCDIGGKTHGESFKGTAIVHEAESEMGKYANKTLSRKYGFLKRVYDFFHQVTGAKRKYLEISLS